MSQTFTIADPVTIVNAGTAEAISAHESTYTHGNLPTSEEKAKLPYLDNVTSDVQAQIDGMGGGFDPSFGAGLYLPLTEDPSSATVIENQGLFGANANFTRIGVFTGSTTANGGRYWTKGDANVGGLRHKPVVDINTATAAYVSHSSTQIVIDDTANDLQALFGQGALAIARRQFKVVIRSTNTGNKAISAYVGAISKSGNRYTITVYTTADGSTNTWNGWEALGTVVYWGIYYAGLDWAAETANLAGYPDGITVAFWYYPSDPTADNIHLVSMWDEFVANTARCLQYVVYQSATNSNVEVDHRNASNSQVDFNATILTQNRWHAIVVRILHAVASRMSVNASMVVVDNANTTPGMLSIEGLAFFMEPISTASILPNGSRIAYPTFWRGNLPIPTEQAWYHYHKNLLGLQDNH